MILTFSYFKVVLDTKKTPRLYEFLTDWNKISVLPLKILNNGASLI